MIGKVTRKITLKVFFFSKKIFSEYFVRYAYKPQKAKHVHLLVHFKDAYFFMEQNQIN